MKEKTKKLLELINNYSKVAGYMFIHESQLLSYIPAINERKLKFENAVPLTLADT